MKIRNIFAAVVTDPKTGEQTLAGFRLGDQILQAVASDATKEGRRNKEKIETLVRGQKNMELVRFKRT